MNSAGVFPETFDFVEITTTTMLDEKHVIPNMGNLLRPGVWFPLGYPDPSPATDA